MQKKPHCVRDGASPVLGCDAVESLVDVRQTRDLLLDLLDLQNERAHGLDVLQGSLLVDRLCVDEVAAQVVVDALDAFQPKTLGERAKELVLVDRAPLVLQHVQQFVQVRLRLRRQRGSPSCLPGKPARQGLEGRPVQRRFAPIVERAKMIFQRESNARQDIQAEGSMVLVGRHGMKANARADDIGGRLAFEDQGDVGERLVALAGQHALIPLAGAHRAERIVSDRAMVSVHRLSIEVHVIAVRAYEGNLHRIREACLARPVGPQECRSAAAEVEGFVVPERELHEMQGAKRLHVQPPVRSRRHRPRGRSRPRSTSDARRSG